MRVWIEIYYATMCSDYIQFHPLMRVWIEIIFSRDWSKGKRFHPLMRVWIEINCIRRNKCVCVVFHPLMRVWIEIILKSLNGHSSNVSPSYEGVD